MSTRSMTGHGAGARAALVPLAAAQARLMAGLSPVAPQWRIVADAVGFVLAEDVLAPADVPPAAFALRSGVAVRALETVGAGPYAPSPLTAGMQTLAAGEPLPAGCDALLPGDAVDLDGPIAFALAAAAPGDMIRRPGEDARAGALLCVAGGRLTAAACAAIAAAGIADVAVRVPRLRVEGADGGPAASLLRDMAGRFGAVAVDPGGDADMVACIGPPSGRFDAVDRGVALRPGGEDMAVGTAGGVPAVLVPDRPDAALAAWFGLIRPGLGGLAGAAPTAFPAVLAGKAGSTAGFADLVLMRRDASDPARWEVLAAGDLPLSRLAAATAAGLVPSESEGYPPGATMPAMLL